MHKTILVGSCSNQKSYMVFKAEKLTNSAQNFFRGLKDCMIHKNLLEAITQQYYTDNYYCLHINRNTNNFFELKVFRDCMSQSQLLLLDSCTLKLPIQLRSYVLLIWCHHMRSNHNCEYYAAKLLY